jgi:hypothetical protein
MIYAFCASIFRDEFVPKRGTGKTLSLTYYLYKKHLAGKRVITNYFTPFSEMMNITDIILGILEGSITNAEIGLTEFQHVLDNLGHKQLKKRLWRLVVSQSRKLGLNFYLDMQILRQVDNDARDHVDYILIPRKYHVDGSYCRKDDCNNPKHRIIIYTNIHPYGEIPIKRLNAEVVGKLYDTNKITIDPIQISKLKRYKELFEDIKIKEEYFIGQLLI